ncbi:MAG: thermonuclease family protein [Dolichospermum sp. JUN01]|nr:thermonuclease family protein [Dolichospermum sp. JUN01]MBS9395697.1 thermonuclease family protein [Dolichospermum sp. OL01]MCO5799322.1 thermonuclease family protein [Dolichospermum sp. OL03]MCS6282408.1 thermonuclease family protein [Dolichospermum sp.]QSV60684.1 MAG: thermonuclease family protein [Dolichospermum sp. LBC05a]
MLINLIARMATVVVRLRVFVPKIIILASFLLLVSCQSHNNSSIIPANVKIARVVSGQSLEVLGMEAQPNLISQVRLIGLDAPDIRQLPWGEDAKQLVEGLIGGANQAVNLEFDLEAKDKFNRTLAYVWKDKLLLNEEVVKQGYALFVARSPNHKYDQRLERAQQWARIMGKGIWNPDKPMRITPGEFRRLSR